MSELFIISLFVQLLSFLMTILKECFSHGAVLWSSDANGLLSNLNKNKKKNLFFFFWAELELTHTSNSMTKEHGGKARTTEEYCMVLYIMSACFSSLLSYVRREQKQKHTGKVFEDWNKIGRGHTEWKLKTIFITCLNKQTQNILSRGIL